MFAKEREMVELGPHSYNLKGGGSGGFDFLNNGSEEHISRCRKGAMTTNSSLTKQEKQKNGHKGGSTRQQKYPALNSEIYKTSGCTFKGKTHSEETKRAISIANSFHQRGDKNSQFGTMWITNGQENRKIKKTGLIPEGWRKGRIFPLSAPIQNPMILWR
jgi:hypothetical protein